MVIGLHCLRYVDLSIKGVFWAKNISLPVSGTNQDTLLQRISLSCSLLFLRLGFVSNVESVAGNLRSTNQFNRFQIKISPSPGVD